MAVTVRAYSDPNKASFFKICISAVSDRGNCYVGVTTGVKSGINSQITS